MVHIQLSRLHAGQELGSQSPAGMCFQSNKLSSMVTICPSVFKLVRVNEHFWGAISKISKFDPSTNHGNALLDSALLIFEPQSHQSPVGHCHHPVGDTKLHAPNVYF